MKIKKFMMLGLCLIVALFSCKKESSNIGAELIDDPNKIGAAITEILEITTYNQRANSIKTSDMDQAVFGAINTEETGLISSAIYSTFTPDSLDRIFPISNFSVETFNLNLHILNTYGVSKNQSFEVYQLKNSVNGDSTYYHFDSLPLINLIGEFTLENIDSGFYSFPLDSSFGASFLKTTDTEFESNENFKTFFSGICIKPKSNPSINNGCIYTINSANTSISLTYNTESPENEFDKQLIFELESTNHIFTKFNQNLLESKLRSCINDTSLGLESFYVQGMGSCIGKIELPSVQKWYNNDSNQHIINKFELQFFVEENPIFTSPNELILTYTNSLNNRYFKSAVLDTKDENLFYKFSISPSEVNTLLENDLFNSANFILENPQPSKEGELTIILGKNSEKPPLLKISHTKY